MLIAWREFREKGHVLVVGVITAARDVWPRMMGAGIGIPRGKRGETCLDGSRCSKAYLDVRGERCLLDGILSGHGIDFGSKGSREKVEGNRESVGSALHGNLIVGDEAKVQREDWVLTEQIEEVARCLAFYETICAVSSSRYG